MGFGSSGNLKNSVGGMGQPNHIHKARARQAGRVAIGRVLLAASVLAAVLGFTALVNPNALSGSIKSGRSFAPELLASQRGTKLVPDIARLNLQCAHSLQGANRLDMESLAKQLDTWAAHVHSETERHLYRFRQNPSEFDDSEAYYRMLMMAVVVAEDFGVRYNATLIGSPSTGSDQFFADSRDVFLHGLLGKRRLGTCSSMPVLYVALGRRLGYPVFLVATKGHLFVRWEGRGERLNLEATGRGMNHSDDQHYRDWPFRVSDQEIAENGYLKSMTPAEEQAAFLSIRGACLQANQRLAEARQAYAYAAKLAPQCRLYRDLAAGLVAATTAPGTIRTPPATQPGPPLSASRPNLDPNPLKAINQPNY